MLEIKYESKITGEGRTIIIANVRETDPDRLLVTIADEDFQTLLKKASREMTWQLPPRTPFFDADASVALYQALDKLYAPSHNEIFNQFTFSRALAYYMVKNSYNLTSGQKIWFCQGIIPSFPVELQAILNRFINRNSEDNYGKLFDLMCTLGSAETTLVLHVSDIKLLNEVLEGVDEESTSTIYAYVLKQLDSLKHLIIQTHDVSLYDDNSIGASCYDGFITQYREWHFKHHVDSLGSFGKRFILSILQKYEAQLLTFSISSVTDFDAEFAAQIATQLRKMPRLYRLMLVDLAIGNTVLGKLTPDLKHVKSLASLYLSCNELDEIALHQIQDLLSKNTYLVEIYLEKMSVVRTARELPTEQDVAYTAELLTEFFAEVKRTNHTITKIKFSNIYDLPSTISKAISTAISKAINKISKAIREIEVKHRRESSKFFGDVDANTLQALLQKNKVSPYAQNSKTGDTILHNAVRTKNVGILTLPALADCNYFIPNRAGETCNALLTAQPTLKQAIQAATESPVERVPSTTSTKKTSTAKSTPHKRRGDRNACPPEETPPMKNPRSVVGPAKNTAQAAAVAEPDTLAAPLMRQAQGSLIPEIAVAMPMDIMPILEAETLHYAIIFNELGILKTLPADRLRSTQSDGKNLLHLAVIHQQTTAALIILERAPELANEADSLHCLPLHYACQSPTVFINHQLLLPLIESTTDLHHVNSCGFSPLYLLLTYLLSFKGVKPEKAFYEIVAAFLRPDKKPSIEQINFKDWKSQKSTTLLHMALDLGDRIFKLFWRAYLNLENPRDFEGKTVLHQAVEKGLSTIIRRIITTQGILLSQTDIEGKRAEDYIHTDEVSEIFDLRSKNKIFFERTSFGLFQMNSLKIRFSVDASKTVDDSHRSHLQKNHDLYFFKEQRPDTENIATFALQFFIKEQVEPLIWSPPEDYLFHMTTRGSHKDTMHAAITRYEAAKAAELKKEFIEGKIALTPKAIEKLSPDKFWRAFHHSEQGILNFLEDPRELAKIIPTLQEKYPVFKRGVHVSAVVLDLHSTRPCCANCSIAILGSLNITENLFAGQLKNLLDGAGYLLPKNRPLTFIARVSSAPASITAQQKAHCDEEPMSVDDDDACDAAERSRESQDPDTILLDAELIHLKELSAPVILHQRLSVLRSPPVATSTRPS